MDNNIKEKSQDFGYCLVVLHHIPNTYLGIEKCVQNLKKGVPSLLHLYYKFDDKPFDFQKLWKSQYIFQGLLFLIKLPSKKFLITTIIAVIIFFSFDLRKQTLILLPFKLIYIKTASLVILKRLNL